MLIKNLLPSLEEPLVNDIAVFSDFPCFWVSNGGLRHSFVVTEVPVGVIKANGPFLIDQAFVRVIDVFSALLGVPLGVPYDLIEDLIEGLLGQGKGCSTICYSRERPMVRGKPGKCHTYYPETIRAPILSDHLQTERPLLKVPTNLCLSHPITCMFD